MLRTPAPLCPTPLVLASSTASTCTIGYWCQLHADRQVIAAPPMQTRVGTWHIEFTHGQCTYISDKGSFLPLPQIYICPNPSLHPKPQACCDGGNPRGGLSLALHTRHDHLWVRVRVRDRIKIRVRPSTLHTGHDRRCCSQGTRHCNRFRVKLGEAVKLGQTGC